MDLFSGLNNDLCTIFEWVLTHVWHGTMAGDTTDFNFDLHTTALSSVDTKTRTSGIAGTFSDNDEVWSWKVVVFNNLVLEIVEWTAAVVVFFLDGSDGDNLNVLETAFFDEF